MLFSNSCTPDGLEGQEGHRSMKRKQERVNEGGEEKGRWDEVEEKRTSYSSYSNTGYSSSGTDTYVCIQFVTCVSLRLRMHVFFCI